MLSDIVIRKVQILALFLQQVSPGYVETPFVPLHIGEQAAADAFSRIKVTL